MDDVKKVSNQKSWCENKMSQIKNVLDGINDRLNIIVKKMRELKDVAIEHSKMKHTKKEKTLKAVFSGPNPTMLACLHFIYGCFTSVKVELSSFWQRL